MQFFWRLFVVILNTWYFVGLAYASAGKPNFKKLLLSIEIPSQYQTDILNDRNTRVVVKDSALTDANVTFRCTLARTPDAKNGDGKTLQWHHHAFDDLCANAYVECHTDPADTRSQLLTIEPHLDKRLQGQFSCKTNDPDDATSVSVSMIQSSSVIDTSPDIFPQSTKMDPEPKRSFNISCELNTQPGDSPTVKWVHLGKELNSVEDKISFAPNDRGDPNIFVKFSNVLLSDVFGAYECMFPSKSPGGAMVVFRSFVNVFSIPVVTPKPRESKNLLEGEALKLDCEATGYPMPTLHWSRESEDEEHSMPVLDPKADARVYLTEMHGFHNGLLYMVDLKDSDRADYFCTASNFYGNGTGRTLVRVKDKWAAVWPLMGILAEVIILVTIILLYERKQKAKKLKEEQELDQELDEQKQALAAPKPTKNGNAKTAANEEVRQRTNPPTDV